MSIVANVALKLLKVDSAKGNVRSFLNGVENNMNNARTTLIRTRANRRAQGLRCRGRVRPRRPGLSKVVDVVFNANGAAGQLALANFGPIELKLGCKRSVEAELARTRAICG